MPRLIAFAVKINPVHIVYERDYNVAFVTPPLPINQIGFKQIRGYIACKSP